MGCKANRIQGISTQYEIRGRLEIYPLRRYILGSGAPGTNAVGASGAINGMKR